ncbi:MAG: gliding motility-associated C-terminal domain-containing protein [Bacteroidetes bacterium]|nr:gliding motility-associated C-terminal domain-containing protein [Bacteroidota bacterium]
MRKLLQLVLALLILGLSPLAGFAQTEAKFDEKKAIEEARKKGIKASEIPGYIDYLRRDFSSREALKKSGHIHTPYETVKGDVHQTVINLTPNNNGMAAKTSNASCSNIGFEQYNFTGWTGTTGQVSTGTNLPVYTATATSIINSAGNNVFMANTINYHTIMTIPATNNVYPNCNTTGYDSAACRVAGTQTISEIPFVSPYSFDPVSVRMNGMNANYRACQLKYVVTTSSTVQRLSFSYAVVLQNPSGHAAGESPYFRVVVMNENTNTVLPGCTSYTFNPKTTVPADSLKQSVVGSTFDPTMYRKWQYYSVDLSTLPIGTSVSVNFEVGGCTQSGHWGYAYVDAECGGIGVPYSNMCSGSPSAILVAPTGFVGYQWFDPSNNPIAAPQGTNDTLIVNPATPGQVYHVQMVSPGSCTLTLNDTIKLTSVNILNTNSSPSCQNGASGLAQVTAAGSSGTLLYSWINSLGSVVSTSATATNLPPGNYTVNVSSTACGTASAVVNVGVSPAQFYSQSASYCGNVAFITKGGGSNYQWYNGTTPIAAPQGTNDTLYINTPVVGANYNLSYTNTYGCRDSVKYTLTLISGGSTYLSSMNNVCPGSSNGTAVINLQTSNVPTYNYHVTGPGGYSNDQFASSSLKDSLSGLAMGVYSYTVNDGACLYASTFTITNISTPSTAAPSGSVICFPNDTARIYMTYGASPPTTCGITPNNCTSPNTMQLFSAGTFTNTSTTYPTPYGNWYTYSKQQFLVKQSDLIAAGLSAGKISSLAFRITNLNTSITNYPNFEIKMGCTTIGNFTSSFETGLSTVYSNANQPVSLGWNVHNFQQSFLWDGISNIIIETCFGMNSSFNYTQNCSIELVNTPYIASTWHVEDSNPVCGNTSAVPNAFTNQNLVPNMRFGFCQNSPDPSTYTVTVLPATPPATVTANNGTITVLPTFTATPSVNTPVSYTVSVKNPIGGCVKDTVIKIIYAGSVTDVHALKDTMICAGNSVTLSASNANGYTWYYMTSPTSSMSISTNPTITVTPPAAGTNTYIIKGGGYCGAAPDYDTLKVKVTPVADLILTPLVDVNKCLNSYVILQTGVSSNMPGQNTGAPYSYSWTTLPGNSPAPGTNNGANYQANSNTTQTLVVTVNGVCANSDKDTVVVSNIPNNLTVSIVDSVSLCAEVPFSLNSLASGGVPAYTYKWTLDPSPSIIGTSPTLNYTTPSSQGNYVVTLTVSDSCGYMHTDYQVINVLPPCSVVIPNVITPNSDGVNDAFVIKNVEHHPNTAVTIYDRWGKKVFESSDYHNEWKGDGTSDGTFFYIVNVPDDKSYNGFITVFHGK